MAFGNRIIIQRTVDRGQRTVRQNGFLFLGSFVFLSSVICLLSSVFCLAENVKESNVAGTFYPRDKAELSGLIQKYMKDVGSVVVEGEPLVLIAPHAGYIYSGPVAAYGFKALAGRSFKTVVVLAASHYFSFQGAAVYPKGRFKTPLGEIEVDGLFAADLLTRNQKLIFAGEKYFEREHSLEVELPFLQESFKHGFKIVPILLGDMTLEDCRVLAEILAKILKEHETLLVASTDLSHHRPYDEAVRYDSKTVDFINESDVEALWGAVAHTGWNVCGIRPVAVALYYAKLKKADDVQVLKYANSGDTAGDKDKVVGYLSAIFLRKAHPGQGDESMLTQGDKKRLLEIARATIAAHVAGKGKPFFAEKSPGLNLKRGAFVTLHKKGELRGCIGQFTSDEPLYRVISGMSIESSSNDYRFSPVVESELKEIDIEISVLSEPALIDDWRKIRLGVDGVIVRSGYSSGVFLPQVATETGWDLETFLGQLCAQKAGLPWDSYKNPATKIYTFQADVFSE